MPILLSWIVWQVARCKQGHEQGQHLQLQRYLLAAPGARWRLLTDERRGTTEAPQPFIERWESQIDGHCDLAALLNLSVLFTISTD